MTSIYVLLNTNVYNWSTNIFSNLDTRKNSSQAQAHIVWKKGNLKDNPTILLFACFTNNNRKSNFNFFNDSDAESNFVEIKNIEKQDTIW